MFQQRARTEMGAGCCYKNEHNGIGIREWTKRMDSSGWTDDMAFGCLEWKSCRDICGFHGLQQHLDEFGIGFAGQ